MLLLQHYSIMVSLTTIVNIACWYILSTLEQDGLRNHHERIFLQFCILLHVLFIIGLYRRWLVLLDTIHVLLFVATTMIVIIPNNKIKLLGIFVLMSLIALWHTKGKCILLIDPSMLQIGFGRELMFFCYAIVFILVIQVSRVV